jgi:hypothetical protein
MAKNTIEINITGASGKSTDRATEIKNLERILALTKQIDDVKAKPKKTPAQDNRELGLIEKEKIALKELKTARDQATDPTKQKQLTAEIEKTTASLKQQTALATKHKNSWNEAAESFQQKFNAIGNLVGGAVLNAVTAVAHAMKSFAVESLHAAESAAKQDRLLLNGLNGRTSAMFVLKKQAEELNTKLSIPVSTITSLQAFGTAQGRSVEQIQKTTAAATEFAAVTGDDLLSAYKKMDMTYEGSIGRLGKLDARFIRLTKEQLANGAAVDLVNDKYKGFALASVDSLDKIESTWGKVKIQVGKLFEGLIDYVAEVGGELDTEKLINDAIKERDELILKSGNTRAMFLVQTNKLYKEFIENIAKGGQTADRTLAKTRVNLTKLYEDGKISALQYTQGIEKMYAEFNKMNKKQKNINLPPEVDAKYADIEQLKIDALADGYAKEKAIEQKRYNDATKQHLTEVNGKLAQIEEEKVHVFNLQKIEDDHEIARLANLKEVGEKRKKELDDQAKKEVDAVIKSEEEKIKLHDATWKTYEGIIKENNKKTLTLEEKKNAEIHQLDLDKVNMTGIEVYQAEEAIQKKYNLLSIEEKKDYWKKIEDAALDSLKKQIDAIQEVMAADITQTETLISNQEKKVSAAEKLAEKGNTKLLKEEQKKLDELNATKERQMQRAATLAQIETTINSIAAIAQQAKQPFPLNIIAISATVAAMIAGFAAARAAAQSGFYEGGFTGEGDPREESRKLGKKDYKYHKGEFVFDHEKTKQNLDLFQKIHRNELDLKAVYNKALSFDEIVNGSRDWMPNSEMKVVVLDSRSDKMEKKMDELLRATKSQERLSVNIDERGFSAIASKMRYKQQRIDRLRK